MSNRDSRRSWMKVEKHQSERSRGQRGKGKDGLVRRIKKGSNGRKREIKENRTERRKGCLLADQSIGKYRHRGEARRRDEREKREGGGTWKKKKTTEKDEAYEET